jgi:hypothetical protein
MSNSYIEYAPLNELTTYLKEFHACMVKETILIPQISKVW